MQLHKFECSYISLHAVPFFVLAAHKNFAVLVDYDRILRSENKFVQPIIIRSNTDFKHSKAMPFYFNLKILLLR